MQPAAHEQWRSAGSRWPTNPENQVTLAYFRYRSEFIRRSVSAEPFSERSLPMPCNSSQMRPCQITDMWLWPAAGYKPYHGRVSIDKAQWRTTTTLRSWKWHSQVVEVYGDYSIHEMNNKRMQDYKPLCSQLRFLPPWLTHIHTDSFVTSYIPSVQPAELKVRRNSTNHLLSLKSCIILTARPNSPPVSKKNNVCFKQYLSEARITHRFPKMTNCME